jgi:hypothetical protein
MPGFQQQRYLRGSKMRNITNGYAYGDVDNLELDKIRLKDIISRQGTGLVLHSIAEAVGKTTVNFGLDNNDVQQIIESLTKELTESILERT